MLYGSAFPTGDNGGAAVGPAPEVLHVGASR